MPLVFALVVACGGGDDGGRASDAGADGGDGGTFEPVAPAPPVFAPCPARWHEVTDADDGVATCEPWPDGRPAECADDEAHFPGGAGCEPIGTPCGAGDFAVDLPAGKTIRYVKAGAPAGGDGSMGAPFARIMDALGAADAGDVVAISKGTFDEVVTVVDPVTLRGACVGETLVRSSVASETAGTIRLFAAASIENLQVGGPRYGIDVSAEGATVQGVLVDGATSGGVSVLAGGALDATDLVVRGTVLRPSDGQLGDGMAVWDGGDARVDRAVFERNHSTAIFVTGAGSTVAASRVWLASTARTATEGLGYGLDVVEGGEATLTDSVVEDDLAAGLKAVGSTLTATGVVVRRTSGFEDGRGGGYGLYASLGATVTLDRVLFVESSISGIRAWDAATSVHARDVVVRDTSVHGEAGSLSGEIRERGYGLDLFSEATASFERAAFTRNGVAAIRALQGATLDATDVTLRATRPDGTGDFGLGVALLEGAHATFTRAAMTANLLAGIAVLGGASLDATDLDVAATGPAPCCEEAAGGTGLLSRDGGAITASSFRSTENAFCGIQIGPDGSMDLSHGVVSDNAIGANVQAEGFDIGRIQEDVVYRGNDETLDTTALPLPDTLGGLGE